MIDTINPGDLVRSRFRTEPDTGRPWQGQVLGLDDERAFTGRSKEATQYILASCKESGAVHDVPVLWSFGASARVYFERRGTLSAFSGNPIRSSP